MKQETYINGYVVRNGTGTLVFHTQQPFRTREALLSDNELNQELTASGCPKRRVHYPRLWISHGKEISFKKLPLPDDIFDDLKWEDEPVKVKLTIERI